MNDRILGVLRNADAFCFDVDSTVITNEAIDELAEFCGKGEEIANLTASAMGGMLTYEDALTKRLDILQPSLNKLKQFIATHPFTLSKNVDILIKYLQQQKIPIYLISGGFKTIILPIASHLGIPAENIYANRLKFYYTGEYAGFDERAPTSMSGGKASVINQLKVRHEYANLILIGDGATDIEAYPPADAFIGYGGNVVRRIVKENAEWFVTDFNEILDVLRMVR